MYVSGAWRTALLFFVCAVATALARDYHVSAAGDDENSGSAERPWRSIRKINITNFRPGDRILFEGGQTFTGTLQLHSTDNGAPGNKVTVTSYGSGRAIIDAGIGRAIILDGCRSVSVTNLSLRGKGRKGGNTASGLVVNAANEVAIDNLDVSGFRSSGVEIAASQNVRITHVHAYDNGFAGISSHGPTSRDLYIGYSLVENNPGDPTVIANHSGNGIVVAQTQGALIEYCEARYNGWDMSWTGNGPVGIWTYQSDKVVIQFCISHHNRSTGADGGGFDFDGGVTNSILQYNYSHDNFGSGYLICQYAGAGLFADNVVRYNISQDDGLKDHDAGMFVWVGGADMKSTLVHNNTIFNTKGSAVAFGVAKGYTGPMPAMTFYNNIFVSRGPQIRGGAEKGRFVGNLYWAMGERGFQVDGLKSLDEWAAATGQEKHDGRLVGLFGDPLLRKDNTGLLSDPVKLQTLVEYQLLPASPAIDHGLDLTELFGIDPGKRDFYGTPVPNGKTYDIGAHEYSGKN